MTTPKRLSVWTILWLAWICAFLGIEIPAALNKTAGDTLSENMWEWFSIGQRKRWWKIRLVVLGLFWPLGVGVAHFMFRAPVFWSVILPGIPFAAVIVYAVLFEPKEGKSLSIQGRNAMRWDQWVPAVLTSGLMALVLAAPPFFADGKLTGAEGFMLAGAFLAGCGLYMKSHPPQPPQDQG